MKAIVLFGECRKTEEVSLGKIKDFASKSSLFLKRTEKMTLGFGDCELKICENASNEEALKKLISNSKDFFNKVIQKQNREVQHILTIMKPSKYLSQEELYNFILDFESQCEPLKHKPDLVIVDHSSSIEVANLFDRVFYGPTQDNKEILFRSRSRLKPGHFVEQNSANTVNFAVA